MSNGLKWREGYRKREVRLHVYREARCRCGMMIGKDTQGHGRLFERMCYEKPRRGPWRYRAYAYFGGTWIRPETLPDDVAGELATLRHEAGKHRRDTWARLTGNHEIVARWDSR